MIDLASLIHFMTISVTVFLPAVCVGIGQGLIGRACIKAMNQQPAAGGSLKKTFYIALALTETAAILSALMGAMLFLGKVPNVYAALAEMGAGIAIALPAAVSGCISALPVYRAFMANARQPLFGNQLMNILLITQSIMQTPIIFGLIIGWLIQMQVADVTTLAQGLKLLASGCALGLGAIGPTIGLALFAQQACKTIGTNRRSYDRIISFTFLSQAMIETPILLALVVALVLLVSPLSTAGHAGLVYVLSCLVISFATFGTGISSGRTARAACDAIGKDLKNYATLSSSSMFGQTFIDTNAIYGLVISLVMLFLLP